MLGHRGRRVHPFGRLLRVLSGLIDCYGSPDAIRLDNGPEMASEAFTEGAGAKGIAIRYIQLGKANQNAFIERFNRTYRTAVLDAHRSPILSRPKRLPINGWLITTGTARTNRSVASRRCNFCLG